jgi:hypothetical protein
MKKITMTGLAVLLAASFGLACAAPDSSGITMSTDPARAAAVEQHARELQARNAANIKSGDTYAEKQVAKPMKHTKAVKHAKRVKHSKHVKRNKRGKQLAPQAPKQ